MTRLPVYAPRWSPYEDMGSNGSAHLQTSHLHLSCCQDFLTWVKTENIRKGEDGVPLCWRRFVLVLWALCDLDTLQE